MTDHSTEYKSSGTSPTISKHKPQARQRKLAGLPPRSQKSAPPPEDNYKLVACAIVNGQTKTALFDEVKLEAFTEGSTYGNGLTYGNCFRVYENGFITPSFDTNEGECDSFKRQFDADTRKFQKLLTEQFDQIYPEIGKQAKAFVDIVAPDGTVLYSALGVYQRKGQKMEVVKPIEAAKSGERIGQYLFPSWTTVN